MLRQVLRYVSPALPRMLNPPMRVHPDWNRASGRPVLPTRPAPSFRTIRRSTWIALTRRERLNLNASSAFYLKRAPGLRQPEAFPNRPRQRRRLKLRHRTRLWSAPIPKRPIEPIGRKVRSVLLRPMKRRRNDRALHPSRPRRALLPRWLKRLPEQSGQTLPGKGTTAPHSKPIGF